MPDIVDNRSVKLTDRVCQYLQQSRAAHFAVGYFYVGGFEAIAAAVPGLEKLRLLIGPATSRNTAEQIARGYQARQLIEQQWLNEVTPRSVERTRMRHATSDDVRKTMSLLDQTDENEQVLRDLTQLVADGTIEVRVYTREPLHAKCYIFDERDPERAKTDPGHVIVGSSNLTVSGITSNTEMNVVLHDPSAHQKVSAWFEELWEDAEDFAPELLREIESSWAVNDQVTPWEIYIKTLYNLFRDQLEAEVEPVDVIDEQWPELAEFQEKAVNWARSILQEYHGVMIADVVGLGKSYIGLALLKWGRLHNMRPLVICPAGLVDMWEAYSDEFDVGAAVVSMGMLTVDKDDKGNHYSVLDEDRYDRDLVLIDESHNFRYTNTQRYEAVENYFSRGDRRVIMLTATPMAIGADDIKNQLRLWPGNGQNLPTGRWSFDEFFGKVKQGEANLPDMLRHVMIRRPRWYVAETFGEWRKPDGTLCREHERDEHEDGCRPVILIGEREYTFPQRELKDPVNYRIDEAYQGLYSTIRRIIDPAYEGDEALEPQLIIERVDAGRRRDGQPPMTDTVRRALAECLAQRLSYARYGLHDYVREDWQDKEPYKSLATAGRNLRGLMRTLLFKRLESSVEAFRATCRTLAQVHKRFITAMDENKIPAGEEMQRAIYDLGMEEVAPSEVMDAIEEAERGVATRYDIRVFHADRLRDELDADRLLFEALYYLVCDIEPEADAKLQRLHHLLYGEIPEREKVILFTQFEDTARYLYEQFKDDPEVEWISGSRKNAAIIGRFAPRSNPALARRYSKRDPIRILISTDVLSEGLNLQDAHYVVNYDLHFNPVRLIQRIGRIDRLTPYFADDGVRAPEKVWAWNFFPETSLDKHLNLKEKIRRRVDEMRRVVGVDAPVLHPSEEIDEEGVIRLYTGDSRVAEDEPEDEDLRSGLLEAEQLIRSLQRERPDDLQRIADLPDGVRSARETEGERRYYVYCQAGSFQQLYLADAEGEVITTDLPKVLAAIECTEDEPRGKLPENINRIVSRVKQRFDEAAKEMQARRETKPRHSIGQRYVLSHLREARLMSGNEDERGRIDLLISAYRQPLSSAVRRRLNKLHKEKVEGEALLHALRRIYNDHQLFRPSESTATRKGMPSPPRIICSEAL